MQRIPTVIDTQAEKSTPEALVNTFKNLLEEADYSAFLNILGIGRFEFSRKRIFRRIFMALCLGLWRLAMKRSAPDCSEEAYEKCLASYWPILKDADAFMVLVRDIASFLPEKGEEDLTPMAKELFARVNRKPEHAELVGMALFLRRLYDYFFNHLM